MNITVYCGNNAGSDPEFIEKAAELGRWMAENGHRLIFGGGVAGMMGAVSRAVLDCGGEATGVAPQFFISNSEVRDDLTELIVTENMSVRRKTMLDLGDAFIALPGGVGTADEFTEVLTMKGLGLLGELSKPVMIYNINGYYDNFLRFLDDMTREGFWRKTERDSTIEVRCIEDIERALESAGREDPNRNKAYDDK